MYLYVLFIYHQRTTSKFSKGQATYMFETMGDLNGCTLNITDITGSFKCLAEDIFTRLSLNEDNKRPIRMKEIL